MTKGRDSNPCPQVYWGWPDSSGGWVPTHGHCVFSFPDLLGPVGMEPSYTGHVACINHGHDPVLYAQLTKKHQHTYLKFYVKSPIPYCYNKGIISPQTKKTCCVLSIHMFFGIDRQGMNGCGLSYHSFTLQCQEHTRTIWSGIPRDWCYLTNTHLSKASLSKTVSAGMLIGMSMSGWESRWTILMFLIGMCFDPMAR